MDGGLIKITCPHGVSVHVKPNKRGPIDLRLQDSSSRWLGYIRRKCVACRVGAPS